MIAPLALLVLCVNPYLDEGRSFFSALRYDRAEPKLRLAIEVPTSTPQERREAFDLLARCLAAEGRASEAEDTYAALLVADPSAPEPPDASPKIQNTYMRAKARLYPQEFVSLKRLSSTPSRLEVQIVDPWQSIQQIVIVDAKDASASPLPVTGDRGSWEPGAARQVYVEARGSHGQLLAALGSARQPLTLEGPVVEIGPPPSRTEARVEHRVTPPREAWAWAHLDAAAFGHLLSFSAHVAAFGGEVGASVSPVRSVDVRAAVMIGTHAGAQLAGLYIFGAGAVSPYLQLRGSVTPLSQGLAWGGGLAAGVRIEAGPGRVILGVAAELYALPPGAAAQDGFIPYAGLLLAGYQLDLLRTGH